MGCGFFVSMFYTINLGMKEDINRNLTYLLSMNVCIVLFAQRKLFLPDSNDLSRNTGILYDK